MKLIAGLGIILVLSLHGSQAVFSPNVTVESCISHRVVVRLVNAADGGLIYIQGSGPECSQTTVSATRDYSFDFDACGLNYDEKFRVIVQQRPHWQTGYDKVIPVMCLVDTSDLKVSGVIYPEESSDTAVNMTTKPTVRMAIHAADGSDGNIREITLNDNVKMIVRLDDEYLEDFDIKAKDCTASLIPVISEECSSDEELFPNFNKETQGVLATDFNAFVPTNLEGEVDVDVSFTCNVEVCKGSCQNTVCGEIVGWGKKKKKRDAEDDVIESVTCGTTLRVKSPHTEAYKEATKPAEYCAQKVVVTTVTSVTALTLIFSWAICGCIVSKYMRLEKKIPGPKKPSKLRRLSEINANFAKSVGRRLSTMLNLPIGYDMRGPKMMERFPEMYPTPPTKRRDSVTVSTSSANEYTDTDDVSIGTTCTCVLRQRLVSSSSQTDSASENAEQKTRPHTLSQIQSNNPITSLSIKSFVRNDSADWNSLMLDRESPQESVNINEPCVDYNEDSRVYFTADEVPRNREIKKSVRRSGNFDFEETPDCSKETGAKTSNVTTIKVQNQSSKPLSNHSKSRPLTNVHYDDYAIYSSVENLPDVFETSDSVGGRKSTSRDEGISREIDTRGGTSVLSTLVSSSKKTINQVTDAITSGLQNKNGFDLERAGSSSDSVRLENDDYAKIQKPLNFQVENDRDDTSKDNLYDEDENFYEPIYFVEKVKLERKFSTHV